MAWQLFEHPLIAAAYALNLGVRARRGIIGPKRHKGDARQIIRGCIADCWDGTHYRASPGYFRQFWTRDLCFSASALARLSTAHRSKTLASLEWAIGIWRKRGSHVTTTIHFFDQPVDVFDYGVDCLPLLLAALHRLDAEELLGKHRRWLEREVAHYVNEVVDAQTGMVRADRKFSAHRDTLVNRCNAYGNSMVALLALTLDDLGWPIPEPMQRLATDPQRILMDSFWDKRGFFVDAPGDDQPSGEGNIWPFWTGVITDEAILRQALTMLEKRGYATPMPLKYEVNPRPDLEPFFVRHVMPDYQGATVWTSLGSMYLQLLKTIDPVQAAPEIQRYRQWIERDGPGWEVIDDQTGHEYDSTLFTQSDESMLWSAIFLDLLRHPSQPPATMRAWPAPAEGSD
jgi:hypothetical protein